MKKPVSRRDFLIAGMVGGAGAMFVLPSLADESRRNAASSAAASAEGTCVALCSHWSYTGIGWNMGIESCVQSIEDVMGMADRPPYVKACANFDARAYEFMAETFPEVTARLKQRLADGRVELIGGTYGQPMGTMFGGESNIRQLVVGRETIRRALGYEMVTFLEEEEFTHPQVPQIVAGAGYRYASLAQADTWGRAGIPIQEFNVIHWRGIDGTTILTIPKNALFGFSPNLEKLVASPAFAHLRSLGKPLIFAWAEFGWEPAEKPAYLTALPKFKAFAEKSPVEFVTCKEYLDKYGDQAKETIYLPMDAWKKLLTWGIGGDQLRIMDRRVEGLLLAAETFDAVASLLGAASQADRLDKAWKDLLTAQSHDVGLCEFTRWQGKHMASLDRIEDHHNLTWGDIGFNHLDAAEKQGKTALYAAADHLARRINSAAVNHGTHVVTVLNSCGWPRNDLVLTGRIHALPRHTAVVVVRDRDGRPVPSQIVASDKDSEGNLQMAEVAFAAQQVPAVGYDTYYLEFVPPPLGASGGPLIGVRCDEASLSLENEHVAVRLDPASGGIQSLIGKPSGRETLDVAKPAFPAMAGQPNQEYPLRRQIPELYDSATSRAKIDWLERGPLRATVRAMHNWRYCQFETRVTLVAGSPCVEVVSRLLLSVPPKPETVRADIQNGFWFSLAPAFQPAKIVRDFPLAVEPTNNKEFHALSFVDFVGEDRGLLLLHAGTQWFRRDAQGRFQNLVVREWESVWSREYGWAVYSEFRHALRPHAGDLTNADRLRAAAAFSRPLLARVGPPQSGDLPTARGFVAVEPAAAHLSCFRKKAGGGMEIRVVETEGVGSAATIGFDFPLAAACETNLLGAKTAEVARNANRLGFPLDPWKIRTFKIVPG